jgi:hypothetical protein
VANVVRIWWLMVKRNGGEAAAIVPIGLLVLIAAGIATLGQHELPAEYVSALLLTTLTTALFLPIFLRSKSILDSRFLRLLPLTDTQVLWLRLVIADPARLVACVAAWAWGVVGVMRIHAGPGTTALALIEVTAVVVAGLILLAILEDTVGLAAPTIFYIVAALVALTVVQVLVTFHATWVETGAAPAWVDALEPRLVAWDPRTSTVWGLADGIGSVALCVVLFVAAKGVAARAMRPRPAGARGRPRGRAIEAIARRLAPRSSASLAAAMAMLYRLYTARFGWLLTAFFAVSAFVLPIPFLLVGVFGFWAIFGHNLLGPDQPFSGVLRYDLMPYSAADAIRARRRAVVTTVTCMVLTVAVPAGLILGWRGTTLRLVAFALALGWFGAAAIGGDRVSRHYPKPIEVRAFMMRGGYVQPIAWLSLLATSIGVVAVFVVLYDAAKALDPIAPVVAQGVLALALSSVALLCISAIARVW